MIAFCLALAAAGAAVSDEAKGAAPFPLHATVGLTQSVGAGTFNVGPWNPYVATMLSLAPSATLGDFNLSLRQRLNFEWTPSDYTTTANQVELYDPALGASYTALAWKELGLQVVPSLGLDLPLSMGSRQAGRLFGVRASGSATWTHDSGFTAGASAGVGYNQFVPALSQRFADGPVRSYEDRTGATVLPRTCLRRPGERIDDYPCASTFGMTMWSGFAGANAGYAMLDGALNFSGSLTYMMGVSPYWGPGDEFRAPNAVAGPGIRQRLIADLSVSYSVAPWFVLSGGAASYPGLLTADTKGIRTPFYDFFTAERFNNTSFLYIDTTFNI